MHSFPLVGFFRESEKIILVVSLREAEYNLRNFCSSAPNHRDVRTFFLVSFCLFIHSKHCLLSLWTHRFSVQCSSSSRNMEKKKCGAEKLRKEDKEKCHWKFKMKTGCGHHVEEGFHDAVQLSLQLPSFMLYCCLQMFLLKFFLVFFFLI